MTKKTIADIDGIKIIFDSEFDEYQVRVKGNPAATYYTDSKIDAMRTADAMRFELINGGLID